MIDRANQTVAQRLTENSQIESMENLELWYETTLQKSFEYDEIYEGSNISSWKDIKSSSLGTTNDGSQTTDANKPVFEKNAFGSGISGLKFSGTQFIDYDQSFLVGTEYTIFIVDKKNTTSGNIAILSGGHATITSEGHHLSFLYAHAEAGGQGNFYFSEFGPFTVNMTTEGYTNLTPIIHTARFSTISGRELYKNGRFVGSRAIDTTPLYSLDSSHIGGYNGGYIGYIGEVIMFSTALTNSKRKEVEEYLAEKYSITLE